MAAALSMSENVSTPAPRAPPSVLSSPSTSHMLSITYLRPAFFSTHSLILVCSTKHCSPLDRVWILLFVSASVFLLAGWPCTGWANSPRNKFARVENRGTRRKMPRKKGLTHLNISGSWKLGLSSGVRCTKVSVCFWPPAESPTQGSVPGQSCCNHIFPTLTSSYIAGFGAHAVALCPLKASPRLSQGRGTPRSSCKCPELLLSLFTHSALSCLEDFPDLCVLTTLKNTICHLYNRVEMLLKGRQWAGSALCKASIKRDMAGNLSRNTKAMFLRDHSLIYAKHLWTTGRVTCSFLI